MISRLCLGSVLLFLIGMIGCGGNATNGDVAASRERSAKHEEPGGSAKPERGPDKFRAKFETTKGDFVIEVTRDWAPLGADRFHELVKSGFYDECRFFRVVPGFVVQFGMNGDPAVQRKWDKRTIRDDPVKQSNKRGYVTFATSGPHSRTTQIFINYGDNSRLDALGFSPFGKVVEGMDVVDKINDEYRERPSQALIERHGDAYLEREFPRLDHVEKATILSDDKQGEETEKERKDK